MAKITLTIPDELFYILEVQGKINKLSTEEIIVKKLDAFGKIGPNDRYLLLHGAKREQVEKLLGEKHLTTPEVLIEQVKKFATLSIEGAEITLSEGELKELDRMSTRNKRSKKDELEVRLKIVRQLIFHSAAHTRLDA